MGVDQSYWMAVLDDPREVALECPACGACLEEDVISGEAAVACGCCGEVCSVADLIVLAVEANVEALACCF